MPNGDEVPICKICKDKIELGDTFSFDIDGKEIHFSCKYVRDNLEEEL